MGYRARSQEEIENEAVARATLHVLRMCSGCAPGFVVHVSAKLYASIRSLVLEHGAREDGETLYLPRGLGDVIVSIGKGPTSARPFVVLGHGDKPTRFPSRKERRARTKPSRRELQNEQKRARARAYAEAST